MGNIPVKLFWCSEKVMTDIRRPITIVHLEPLGLVSWKHILWTIDLNSKRAVTCDFQQCGILTSVDSDEPVQPPFTLWNSKLCSVSCLTLIEYLNDKQRLWSHCAYAQAGLSLCWSHIPHCWKSHATTQIRLHQCSPQYLLKKFLLTELKHKK